MAEPCKNKATSMLARTNYVLAGNGPGEFTCETPTPYIARLDMPASYMKRPIVDQDSGRILDLQKV